MHDFLVTLPDRIKTSARLLGERIDLLVMSLIDRYLEQRDFERVATQFEVAFDDLPILYDEGSFPILPGAADKDGYLVSRFDLDLLPDGLYTKMCIRDRTCGERGRRSESRYRGPSSGAG